jgi:hypothetical protein
MPGTDVVVQQLKKQNDMLRALLKKNGIKAEEI